jgi:hypothetical protein
LQGEIGVVALIYQQDLIIPQTNIGEGYKKGRFLIEHMMV